MKPLSRKRINIDKAVDGTFILLVVVLAILFVTFFTGCASSQSTVTPAKQSGTIKEAGPTKRIIIDVGTPAKQSRGFTLPEALAACALCADPKPVVNTTTQVLPDDGTVVRGPNGFEVRAKPGEPVHIEMTDTGGTLTADQSAQTAGASASGDAIGSLLKTKLGAWTFPRLAARGGGMSGSGSESSLDIESASGGGAAALYILGGIVMIAGCAAGYFAVPKSVKLAAVGIALGILLIGCGVVAQEYPWVFLVGLLALVAAGGAWVYQSRRHSADSTALRVVTQQIEGISDAKNPESLGRKLKEQVAASLKKSRVRGVVESAIARSVGTVDPTK